jgi:predicted dehydrogenase
MKDLRIAIIGAGFWAKYQVAAWGEVGGIKPIAICDCTRSKAEALAKTFDILAVYDDSEKMLREEKPDFIDVITSPETHEQFVLLAAKHNIPVISQKPMSTSLESAARTVQACKETNTPFFVHEPVPKIF